MLTTSKEPVLSTYDDFPELSQEYKDCLVEYNQHHKPHLSADAETPLPTIDLENMASLNMVSQSPPIIDKSAGTENWQD